MISCCQLGYRMVTWPFSSWFPEKPIKGPGRVAMVAVDASSVNAVLWLIHRWWKGDRRDRVVLVHVPEGDLASFYPRTIRLELDANNYRKVSKKDVLIIGNC